MHYEPVNNGFVHYKQNYDYDADLALKTYVLSKKPLIYQKIWKIHYARLLGNIFRHARRESLDEITLCTFIKDCTFIRETRVNWRIYSEPYGSSRLNVKCSSTSFLKLHNSSSLFVLLANLDPGDQLLWSDSVRNKWEWSS